MAAIQSRVIGINGSRYDFLDIVRLDVEIFWRRKRQSPGRAMGIPSRLPHSFHDPR